jgi:hypothetical protein
VQGKPAGVYPHENGAGMTDDVKVFMRQDNSKPYGHSMEPKVFRGRKKCQGLIRMMELGD